MPPRLPIPPLCQSHFRVRAFHTARRLLEATHYETLQIPINATAAEIKKSFYALSKAHHPDLNPNDPTASEKFVKISEAYHVLGNQAERQKYDRDHLPRQRQSTAAPQGSYSSSSYQPGGRSPSGLSKRRTTFRGPPPSFYRSGGWGAHSEKRREAAEETASNARATTDHHNDAGPSAGYSDANEAQGGMGYGQDPFGGNDVPHFDREGHLRTHSNQEQRRRRKSRSERETNIVLPPGLFSNLLMVGGLLTLAVLITGR